MTAKLETIDQQYRRIFSCLTEWRKQTSLAAQAYYEAKTSECWKNHHATWKDFIEACGFTEEWGRQLCLTGERIVELKELLNGNERCNSVAPENAVLLEKVNSLTPGIRKVLDGVPLASQIEALKETDDEKPLTAKSVKAAKKIVEPPPGPKPEPKKEVVIELDKEGVQIPSSVLEDWKKADSFRETLADLERIKRIVANAVKEEELAFVEVTNSTVSNLQNIRADLQRVIPHAICPTCQGHQRKKCSLCKARGFLSKFAYETFVPEEIKKMRAKKK